MALSQAEQTQIKALITREGGVAVFTAEVQAANVSNTQAASLATLGPAVTVTVTDWTAVTNFVAGATNVTLYSVMAAIKTAATAHDATQMGPLLVALYGAVKAHLSL